MPLEFPATVQAVPFPIPTHVVAPVQGPPGPQGPQGEPGDPGAALAYVYTTSNPALTHQINHGLAFRPGGVTCLDADGSSLLGFTVTHPAPGVTEVTFGMDVTPTIFLS